MIKLTVSLAVFYGVSSAPLPRSASGESADSVNKARRRMDGYTTWDGMQIKHSGVGGGRCGCSGGHYLPGTHVVECRDRSVAVPIPTSAHTQNTEQTHDK